MFVMKTIKLIGADEDNDRNDDDDENDDDDDDDNGDNDGHGDEGMISMTSKKSHLIH